jgi:hypothetical protein
VRRAEDSIDPHSAGQAHAERARGEFQWPPVGRVLKMRTGSAPWLMPGEKSALGETSTTVNGRTAVWATERRMSSRRS